MAVVYTIVAKMAELVGVLRQLSIVDGREKLFKQLLKYPSG